jgi:hypothetical protein
MQSESKTPVTLTREELYELVWTTPMRHLAERFGVSDVGLAKICEKHQIPRPPQGYWVRKEHGKRVLRTALPPIQDEAVHQITLQPQDAGGPQLNELEGVVAERQGKNRIMVPERLDNPPPVVAATAKMLRAEKPDREGMLWGRGQNVLPVKVTMSTLSRAMRIMHALITALEKRGHSLLVETPQYGRSTMYAVVEQERIEFTLREVLKQERHVMTAQEERETARYSWRTVPAYDLRPTGRLKLEIETYSRQSVRRRWEDGKKQALEACLNDVVVSFLRLAHEAKEDRRQREEERRQRQEWERQRQEKLRLIQEEERRIEELHAQADSWYRSQRIRAYLGAVRDAAISRHGTIQEGSELDEWLKWGEQQADRLDPLHESPPSIVDEKPKWERGYH